MAPHDQIGGPAAGKDPFRLVLVLAAVIALTSFGVSLAARGSFNLTLFLFYKQDLRLLYAGFGLLLLCFWRLPVRSRPLTASWRTALAVGGVMALAALAGHFWILSGYDMSRDEQLASFDAAIFARGLLVAPLPAMWHDHASALNATFMYPTSETSAWVSAYLPLNAALRTLFGMVGNAALTGPAMILLGAAALWGCARRIWPDRPEAALVALLLYAGSGQVLFNGMTAYAMPAHLALNLCWLWLFLRRTIWSDLAALAIGFVATGLHQPIVHPMFAAPILLLLVLGREWRRAALYLLGYATIGAFWLWWPGFTWSLVEGNPLASPADGVDYWTRLVAVIEKGDALRFENMGANLLRFFGWQHLLLLPLMVLGLRALWQSRLAAALAGGIVLTLVVMTVILPYQGHGFGYRYLHGLIGNAILLGVFGWVSLGERLVRWRPLLLRATAAGLFVLLPMQAWMAHQFYAPFARASARIDASGADYVVVGAGDAPFAMDLVVNPPFLDMHPIRLLREKLNGLLARAICAQHPGATVAFAGPALTAPINAYFGRLPAPPVNPSQQVLSAQLAAQGCRVETIG